MISEATLADVPALNKLVNSAYRGESSRKGWTTEADLLDGTRIDEDSIRLLIETPQSQVLKYTEEGKIIGCVRLDNRGKKMYLGMFAVDPEIQGKGIGKKLLQAADEEAKKQNCQCIEMTVISVRSELIAWYQRHGYKLTGEEKPMVLEGASAGIPKMNLRFVVLEKAVL
ncbi:MAG: GNAT family N-acetyltransferase [Bacteroidetes bacterium]|nr:GNAT family N-acetyltransferase [Bacteroidota bacterium]